MFRRTLLTLIFAIMPAIGFANTTHGTADDAVAMVDRAIAHFEEHGLDSLVDAISDTGNPDFHDRDLYVFIQDVDGLVVAHGVRPALNGRNTLGLTDPNGHNFVAQMVEVARSDGSGWVDYIWPNPTTGAPEPKRTWVSRLDDTYWAAVGIYVK